MKQDKVNKLAESIKINSGLLSGHASKWPEAYKNAIAYSDLTDLENLSQLIEDLIDNLQKELVVLEEAQRKTMWNVIS